ncbi:MAG: diaminopimelate epimerase [Chloroflexi bacterium]|nr:diaminopimelate epimerase [Chloroflexota bacterium]
MTAWPFWKMHGAGNDFVLTDGDDPAHLGRSDEEWAALAERVCNRHFGVGADGLIAVLPSEAGDRRMRIFNADGSESEMCGNGIRCLVKFALDQDDELRAGGKLRVETLAGVLDAVATPGADGTVERVRVSMGEPHFAPEDLGALVEQAPPVLGLPLEAAGTEQTVTLVSMGNPHAVTFIDEPVGVFELERIGPEIEHHPVFANRTNFEIVRVRDRGAIDMRVWERGVGETLACGSGACAAAVASRLHGFVDDRVDVHVPGGTLGIGWDGDGEVSLEGPATLVFASTWEDPA